MTVSEVAIPSTVFIASRTPTRPVTVAAIPDPSPDPWDSISLVFTPVTASPDDQHRPKEPEGDVTTVLKSATWTAECRGLSSCNAAVRETGVGRYVTESSCSVCPPVGFITDSYPLMSQTNSPGRCRGPHPRHRALVRRFPGPGVSFPRVTCDGYRGAHGTFRIALVVCISGTFIAPLRW